jgi:hypothetical protein
MPGTYQKPRLDSRKSVRRNWNSVHILTAPDSQRMLIAFINVAYKGLRCCSLFLNRTGLPMKKIHDYDTRFASWCSDKASEGIRFDSRLDYGYPDRVFFFRFHSVSPSESWNSGFQTGHDLFDCQLFRTGSAPCSSFRITQYNDYFIPFDVK